LNLSDLVAKAETFAAAVAQDPQRYAGALQSGLAALNSARDVVAKLHAQTLPGATLAPAAPGTPTAAAILPELEDWKAIAETQEADAAVQAELARDGAALTAEEVEDALVTVVKIFGLVGKAAL
jgi:hypothetical protein